MPQQIDKKKIYLYFVIFFMLASLNNKYFLNFNFFTIDKIVISGLENDNKINLSRKLDEFKFQNILFLNQKKIYKTLDSFNLIESYRITKKYPSSLYVKVKKTNLIASTKINSRSFYIGSNGKLIETAFFDKNLPYLFGKPKIDEFINFKMLIDDSKFSYTDIIELYHFPSNRWDIKTKNGILIKLPKNETLNSLNLIFDFMNSQKLSKTKIIDARIKNKLIIK